ncbi:hypothetical protein E8E13_003537 [Curvularia kusanoi]|uniref:Uncharacterized protein n=1 Tax=Curvularia kusanoi TaxID=90978 RepID=A0A9P4W795_CURKU|nr:hypothetical protein E8E13_003537 [Curvularia kusanoi]
MIPITIAPPLKEVSELKVRELKQLREDFKNRYGIDEPRPTTSTLQDRIATLVKDIQKYDSYLENENDLTIISGYVEETKNDGCISEQKLLKFEQQILEKLTKRLHRYDATILHLQLMDAAMSAKDAAKASVPALGADPLSDDDFEVVDTRLEGHREKFEAEAFTAKNVDVRAFERYLTEVLDQDVPLPQLRILRNSMGRYGDELLEGEADIEEDDLEWCIMDILKNDLISDDRRKVLESYLQNQVAMRELVSVLNMRTVRDWNWKSADKGLPVVVRQDCERRYHIVIEEDLVDMLYLHCTALGWADKLKKQLSRFIRFPPSDEARTITPEDSKERAFFLDPMPYEPSEGPCTGSEASGVLPSELPGPPPTPPPANDGVIRGVYVTARRSQKKRPKKKFSKGPTYPSFDMPLHPPPPPPPGMCMPPPLPPPPPPPAIFMPPPPPPPLVHPFWVPSFLETLDAERRRTYNRDFFLSRLPTYEGCRHKVTPVEEVQANMIKTLAAECKIRAALDGQVSCSVIDFHSLASGLPHQIVLSVLQYIGVPVIIVDFFSRFLGAKLNIGPHAHSSAERVLARACGVPERHGMELLCTEAVMFLAEFAVTKRTGAHLYRLGSRCYFVGTEEQNTQAIQELQKFSSLTKLEFDDVSAQPGGLHIGFLEITGDAVTIKKSLVEDFAIRTKKQLCAQNNVYDWVRVWNSTVGTYAAHLFGPLVDLFGKPHLDAVKVAYKRIFAVVLEGQTLTAHVKNMLGAYSSLEGEASALALEAFIHMPPAFGGLGVKNPFIALNLARNISEDPEFVIQEYRDVETAYYEAAQANWSALSTHHINKKFAHVYSNVPATNNISPAFMSKATLTKHREYALFPHLPSSLLPSSSLPPPEPEFLVIGEPSRESQELRVPYLLGLYKALLNEPAEEVVASSRIRDEVQEAGSMKRWGKLDPLDQWVLQMYGGECLEWFGGLDLWCEQYVPKVAMVLVRGEEREEDSGSEVSTMTSVA